MWITRGVRITKVEWIVRITQAVRIRQCVRITQAMRVVRIIRVIRGGRRQHGPLPTETGRDKAETGNRTPGTGSTGTATPDVRGAPVARSLQPGGTRIWRVSPASWPTKPLPEPGNVTRRACRLPAHDGGVIVGFTAHGRRLAHGPLLR